MLVLLFTLFFVHISGEIPLDSAITETSDNGTPIVISHPESLYVSHDL